QKEGLLSFREELEHHLTIRRERERAAFAEPHGGRAVSRAEIARPIGSATATIFSDEQPMAVSGKIRDVGAIDPGEIAFLRLAWNQAEDFSAPVVAREQHAALT